LISNLFKLPFVICFKMVSLKINLWFDILLLIAFVVSILSGFFMKNIHIVSSVVFIVFVLIHLILHLILIKNSLGEKNNEEQKENQEE